MNTKNPLGAVCAENIPEEAKRRLSEICEKVFFLPPDSFLAPPVASHPDMIFSVIGKSLVCHKKYFEENEKLIADICSSFSLEPVLSEYDRRADYPYDIGFNVLVTDKFVFCNKAHTAKEVLDCAEREGLRVVNVKQGYAACSSVYVANTVISADVSIIKSAGEAGVDTYRIHPGGIVLEPYDTGFIGGATGVYGDALYIFGDLYGDGHFFGLYDFSETHKVKIIPLCDGAISDFGGIKFFKTI